MGKDYFINEGNQIGYMPTEFSSVGNLVEAKLIAGAKITKGQVVEVTDSMTVAPTSAASANVLGVAMFDVEAGEPVSVECEGLFKLTASGAINAPMEVESAAGGKVAAKNSTPASVVKVIGLALSDATDGNGVYVKFSI